MLNPKKILKFKNATGHHVRTAEKKILTLLNVYFYNT